MSRFLKYILPAMLFCGCNGNYTPKPYGYFRIDLPENSYHFSGNQLPYRFEISDMAAIEADNSRGAEPYWINIVYAKHKAMINITYRPIISDTSLLSYIQDAHRLAYKHTVKADAINEQYFQNTLHGTFGLLYNIEGNTGSPAHFFITDSTQHFLRGSLHLYERPNRDSLAPIINYIKNDIVVLMETIQFGKEGIKP